MSGRGALAFVLATCLLLAGASPAAAATDKREVQARADFAAGRYQQAIDTFALLYGETLNPIYLRNIGRCQQKLRHPREAIDAFQEYLRKGKSLSAEERAEVEGFIKEMEALIPAPAPASTSPPTAAAPPTPVTAPTQAGALPPAVASPAPTPPAEPAPAPPASASAVDLGARPASPTAEPPAVALGASATPTGPADGGRGWRTAGLVTALGGVALVGAGVAFGLAARSVANQVSTQYDPVRADNGKLDERLSFVGYGVGGAAIVTGALLYAHGAGNRPAAPAAVGLRARPIVGRQGGGLVVGGTF